MVTNENIYLSANIYLSNMCVCVCVCECVWVSARFCLWYMKVRLWNNKYAHNKLVDSLILPLHFDDVTKPESNWYIVSVLMIILYILIIHTFKFFIQDIVLHNIFICNYKLPSFYFSLNLKKIWSGVSVIRFSFGGGTLCYSLFSRSSVKS